MFSYSGCTASYVGETTRRLGVRVNEHLSTDKKSAILKHLDNNSNCKNLYDDSCFQIIDSARTEFALKLKEAMHIEWKRPLLNKQTKHVTLSITV